MIAIENPTVTGIIRAVTTISFVSQVPHCQWLQILSNPSCIPFMSFFMIHNCVRIQDLDVRVQAGLGYLQLNDFLRDKGLWFPLDPGPGATVGGMCACRCR